LAAGGEETAGLGEELGPVGEVFDDFEGDDEVEAFVGEGEFGGGGGFEAEVFLRVVLAGVGDGFGAAVDARWLRGR
jgi:hypothetical protein